MTHYDVFNGDADGICALHQLRLENPVASTLVTGVKREIALLERVEAQPGDQITVLDISLDKNRAALQRILEQGASVLYIDHHYAGEMPTHERLETNVNTSADVCTGLLVNGRLKGKHLAWAVVAAYGDNLHDSACRAAAPLKLDEQHLLLLKDLGTYINYNAYGSSLEDLYFHPADLYRRLEPYADPFDFIGSEDVYATLRKGYEEDMSNAHALTPSAHGDRYALYLLPNASWARRVSGTLGNELARSHPERAHALVTEKPEGGYVVSVRAPLQRKSGADTLCRRFETGGGREAAAGINHLPDQDLDAFVAAFREAYA